MRNIKCWLAALITVGFLGALFVLFQISLPEASKEVLLVLIGCLTGIVKDVYSYYFGSSEGSARKTEIMSNQVEPANSTALDNGGYVTGIMMLALVCLSGLGLLLGPIGCATTGKQETPQSIAAKSLLSTRQAIIASATTADSLCNQGYLKKNDCSKAEKIYTQAQAAYTSAADAFLLYLITDSAVARQQYDTIMPQLAIFLTSLDQLSKTVQPVQGGKL